MSKLQRKAIALFRCENATKATQRHNQRAWLAAIELLGAKHILAIPVQRRTHGQ